MVFVEALTFFSVPSMATQLFCCMDELTTVHVKPTSKKYTEETIKG
jgi:hypothetical protein